MQDVFALILGGGRGTPLYPLTKTRSQPAVPIAGKYRLIDVAISNSINSGINQIYVLTQFLSVSLHRHISNTYKFDPFHNGYVRVLAAQQTNEAAEWYQGTADAIRQNLRNLPEQGMRDVLILSGDQLYRMDFRELIQQHRESGADVTISVKPTSRRQASGVGVLRVDDRDRVVELIEKPHSDEQFQALRKDATWRERHSITDPDGEYLANLGIYVFNRKMLTEILTTPPFATDLVREIFPRSLPTHQIHAVLFKDYWRDLGTIQSYYEAHMEMIDDEPPFDFHTAEGVIYTRMRDLPAARVNGADLDRCLVADGCVVQPGARLERCILGVRSRIGERVTIRDSIINGTTRFETDEQRLQNAAKGLPSFTVGSDSVIERAILDKDCRIGKGVKITNANRIEVAEGSNYAIRDGIVIIPHSSVVPDGTVI